MLNQCKFWNASGSIGKLAFFVPCFIIAILVGSFLELFLVENFDFSRPHLPWSIHHHVSKRLKWRVFQQNEYSSSTASQTRETTPATTETTAVVRHENKFDQKGDTLLNLHDFKWIRNNDSICSSSSRKGESTKLNLIPVLVHTARSHFAERLTIRKSWGSIPPYKNRSLRLVFLLGVADRGADPSRNEAQFQEQERLLNEEHSKFGDLITGSFLDTYKNLTYKHMMGYKWILNFCPEADLILKIDDDMFIDIMRFIDWRTEDLLKKNPPPSLYCNTFVGTKPQRCVGCKWYASEAEWPLDFYPDYCSGWAYGITTTLMKKLYSVIPTVNFFWVDDVYATGALMEQLKKDDPAFKLNVKHLWGQVRGLDFKNFRPMCEANDMSMKRKFGAVVPIARGSNFDRDMMCLWNKTLYDSKLLNDKNKDEFE